MFFQLFYEMQIIFSEFNDVQFLLTFSWEGKRRPLQACLLWLQVQRQLIMNFGFVRKTEVSKDLKVLA